MAAPAPGRLGLKPRTHNAIPTVVPDPRDRWPALMDLTMASEYLSLAPGSLVAFLRRNGIESVDVGARLRRWRRHDLDALIARTPAIGSTQPARVLPKMAEDALAAVERRSFARSKARRQRTIQ
jgi:hypothetical protein